jgi:flagellin-specific chaperone FliS
MSGQAALRVSPAGDPREERGAADERTVLVERSFAAVEAALDEALHGFGAGSGTKLHGGVSRAIAEVARLRECLDYEAAPVLSAYLNSMFDYVIAQLIRCRAARDLQSLGQAAYVMTELAGMFAAVHRRASEAK